MGRDFDFSTAEAVCNDALADTWEVRALSEGEPWTVSESSIMSREEAETLAAIMRQAAANHAAH